MGTTTTVTTYVGSLFETDNKGRSTKYIFLGDQRIASITQSPTLISNVLYYHADHLGGANVLSNADGTKKELIEYEPYGLESRHEKYGSSEEIAWYYFTGKPKDDETGLIFFGARYYDPSLGRFITPDSIIQDPYDPQTLNRYSYTSNNPINRVDPTGHKWSWKKFWKAAVGVVVGIVAAAIAGPAGLGLVTSAWGLGAVGGAVAGAVTGGLEGGWKGAMFGALTGGALGGLGGWGYGIAYANKVAGQFMAGMLVAGAGVAAATDSWDSFAGGLVGTGAGMAIGKGITTAYKEQFANYRAGNGFVANKPIGQQNQGRGSAAMNVDAGSDAVNSQALSNREWKFGENIGPGGYYDENNVFRITIGENETAYVPTLKQMRFGYKATAAVRDMAAGEKIGKAGVSLMNSEGSFTDQLKFMTDVYKSQNLIEGSGVRKFEANKIDNILNTKSLFLLQN